MKHPKSIPYVCLHVLFQKSSKIPQKWKWSWWDMRLLKHGLLFQSPRRLATCFSRWAMLRPFFFQMQMQKLIETSSKNYLPVSSCFYVLCSLFPSRSKALKSQSQSCLKVRIDGQVDLRRAALWDTETEWLAFFWKGKQWRDISATPLTTCGYSQPSTAGGRRPLWSCVRGLGESAARAQLLGFGESSPSCTAGP